MRVLVESTSIKISSETAVNGKESKSELYEAKEFKSESKEARSESRSIKAESYSSEIRSSSQARDEKSESRSSQAKEEKSETRSSQAKEEKSETRSSQAKEEKSEIKSSSTARESETTKQAKSESYGSKSEQDSISLSLRTTREKSAEEKLEELDDKPKFTKTIRGASVERKYRILHRLKSHHLFSSPRHDAIFIMQHASFGEHFTLFFCILNFPWTCNLKLVTPTLIQSLEIPEIIVYQNFFSIFVTPTSDCNYLVVQKR